MNSFLKEKDIVNEKDKVMSNNKEGYYKNSQQKDYCLPMGLHYMKSSSINESINHFQVMLSKYEGMCNFIIFAMQSSPYIMKKDKEIICKCTLSNFFNVFESFSAYGNDIYFLNEINELITVNYSPTLSSMFLIIKDKPIIKTLSNTLTNSQSLSNAKAQYSINDNLLITIKGNDDEAYIEYYETKPVHLRKIFSEKINDVLKEINLSITIEDIDRDSWFCIAWTPLKASKQQMMTTAFLVYYQFAHSDSEGKDEEYEEIPLIGILPIRFDEKTWLRRIRLTSGIYSGLCHAEMYDFQMAFNDSIMNVHEFIFKHSERTSYDYDFYSKTIQKNVIN